MNLDSPHKNKGHFAFSDEQINCISDSLQQRGSFKTLESFLQIYDSSGGCNGGGGGGGNPANNTGHLEVSESVLRVRKLPVMFFLAPRIRPVDYLGAIKSNL